MMGAKRFFYILSKVTLIDEILGFVYWALALYGLFKIFSVTGNAGFGSVLSLILALGYAFLITLVYIYGLRRLTKFFKGEPADTDRG